MNWERRLLLDLTQRMRESEQVAKRRRGHPGELVWLARARAFDECITELKGNGLGAKKGVWG